MRTQKSGGFFKSFFSSRFNPEKYGNAYFFSVNSEGNISTGEANPLKEFLEIPELNAIINIRARAMASSYRADRNV